MKNYNNIPKSVREELKDIPSKTKSSNETYKKTFLSFFNSRKLNVYGKAAQVGFQKKQSFSFDDKRHLVKLKQQQSNTKNQVKSNIKIPVKRYSANNSPNNRGLISKTFHSVVSKFKR